MSHVKFLLLHILPFISGSVLLPHPEKNPLASWGCALLLCKQRHSTHLSYHGIVVPGKSCVKLPAHLHALTLWLNQHVAFGCSSLASPYIIDIALTCFFSFFPSHQEHHEEDFFLYIAYSDESVYGDSQREIWSHFNHYPPFWDLHIHSFI